MRIDLTQYERGDLGPAPALPVASERLDRLQRGQLAHRRRAIIAFEGWAGSGRRGAIRRLAASWDPCAFSTHCPATEEQDQHWLARFWTLLPGGGHTLLLHGSWHAQVVAERLAGRLTDKAWARRCDEINEFEAQQADFGTLLVKLFFHVTADVQADRLAARAADPWHRSLAEVAARDPRQAQQSVWNDLLSHTNTRWAPWTPLDANGADAGTDAALAAIAAAFDQAIPHDPPRDQRAVSMVQQQSA